MLIKCNCMPEDRSAIHTPETAKHQPHLKSIAHLIPPLAPNAQILLLLGHDILQLHKVREQHNELWSVKCVGTTHKPSAVSVYRTNILEDRCPSYFSPCTNKLYLRERLTAQTSVKASLFPQFALSPIATSSFERMKDDEKIVPSNGDRQFIQLMDSEMFMDDTNSWIAPLHFCSPRLPNNSHFNSLCRTLHKKSEMREHFMEFLQRIFDNEHAEPAPPVNPGEEC